MINRIEGPGSVRPPQPIKRAGKSTEAGSANFAKHLDESGETGAAHGVNPAGTITGVLGVQEVDDALAHASRGKLRAQDILDRLEDLRLEILTGTISREKLLYLARVVNSRRAAIDDPRLAAILDEIDLRAQVELAKLAP